MGLLAASRHSVRTRIVLNFVVVLVLVTTVRMFSHWIEERQRERLDELQTEYSVVFHEFFDVLEQLDRAATLISRRADGEQVDIAPALQPLREEVRHNLQTLEAQSHSPTVLAIIASAEQRYGAVTEATDGLLAAMGASLETDLSSGPAMTAAVNLFEESRRFSRALQLLAQLGMSQMDADLDRVQQRHEELSRINGLAHLVAILIAVILVLRLARSIIRPIDALTVGIEEFRRGDPSPIGLASRDEFGRLAQCFDEMSEEIQRMLSEGKKVSEVSLMVCATLDLDELAARLLGVVHHFIGGTEIALTMEDLTGERWLRFVHRPDGTITRDLIGGLAEGAASASPRQSQSIISIPLIAQEKVIGSLEVRDFDRTVNIRRQANLVSSLLVSVSMALRNAQYVARLEAEKEKVASQVTELEQAYAQLERTQRFKSRFLAGLSHQVRTPLNSVIGCADLMLGGVLGEITPKQREALGSVNRAGHQLLLTVDLILNYARLEAGEVEMLWGEFDLAKTIAEAAERVTSSLVRPAFRVTTDVAPEAAVWNSDRIKVRYIVQGLLEHAALWADASEAAISARQEDGALRITVHDDGRQIPPELLATIFEPFQGPSHEEDTGLRLALAKSLAERLGGTLEVEGSDASGSTFALSVPHHARHESPDPPGDDPGRG